MRIWSPHGHAREPERTLNQVILRHVLFKLIYELYCCYEFPPDWHHCLRPMYMVHRVANLLCFVLTFTWVYAIGGQPHFAENYGVWEC